MAPNSSWFVSGGDVGVFCFLVRNIFEKQFFPRFNYIYIKNAKNAIIDIKQEK